MPALRAASPVSAILWVPLRCSATRPLASAPVVLTLTTDSATSVYRTSTTSIVWAVTLVSAMQLVPPALSVTRYPATVPVRWVWEGRSASPVSPGTTTSRLPGALPARAGPAPLTLPVSSWTDSATASPEWEGPSVTNVSVSTRT